MASILIDNDSRHVSTPGWVVVPLESSLGGTISRSNNTDEFTSFNVTFNGTTISLYVVTELLALDSLASSSVSIDGILSGTVPINPGNIENPTLLVEQRFFSSDTLEDATHTLSVTNFPSNFSLDYAIAGTGSQTPVTEEVMILDDDNIHYSGGWIRDNTTSYTIPLPSSQEPLSLEVQPVNSVIHRVSTIGLIHVHANFTFTGTSLSIYGILEGSVTGSETLSIGYTLDGFQMQQQYTPASQTQANYRWYSNTTIPVGPHTVRIDVLEVNGIDFILDYITYTPSLHPVTSSITPSATPGGMTTAGSQLPTKTVIIISVISAVGGIALILIMILLLKRLLSGRRSQSPPVQGNENASYMIQIPPSHENRQSDVVNNNNTTQGLDELVQGIGAIDAFLSRSPAASTLSSQRKSGLSGTTQHTDSQVEYTEIIFAGENTANHPSRLSSLYPSRLSSLYPSRLSSLYPSRLSSLYQRLVGSARSQPDVGTHVTPFTLEVRNEQRTSQAQDSGIYMDASERERLSAQLKHLQELALNIRRGMVDARDNVTPHPPPLHSTSTPRIQSSVDNVQAEQRTGQASTTAHPPPYDVDSVKDERLARFMANTSPTSEEMLIGT